MNQKILWNKYKWRIVGFKKNVDPVSKSSLSFCLDTFQRHYTNDWNQNNTGDF